MKHYKFWELGGSSRSLVFVFEFQVARFYARLKENEKVGTRILQLARFSRQATSARSARLWRTLAFFRRNSLKCFLSSWNFEFWKMTNGMRMMNVVIRTGLVLSVLCCADAWKWNRFKFLIGHDLLPPNPETSMTTVKIN